MKYHFPNDNNNEWLQKYNDLVDKYESYTKRTEPRLSFHHILPRSTHPQFKEDPQNHLWLPLIEHYNMHYYLWKAIPEYCAAFWFCYVYFRKHFGCKMTDEEETQLKNDMKEHRRRKRNDARKNSANSNS